MNIKVNIHTCIHIYMYVYIRIYINIYIFYIAHLGVRYEIYPLSFPFDLRCQSGIYIYIYIYTVSYFPGYTVT